MIRIAICDDNSIQLDLLEEILDEYIENRKIDATIEKFGDSVKLAEHVKNNGFYDIYFLDMIMPNMNGLELATTLRMLKDPGKIIFLTSTVEYAVVSYDVKAFYYMLKPADMHKIYHVLDEAISEFENDDAIVLKREGSDIKILLKDLMYIDLVNRATCYHLRDGRMITDKIIRGAFKDEVSKIASDDDFKYCGISLLLNTKYIDAIDSDTILLKDGSLLYPSKSGISQLREDMKRGAD